MDPVGPWYASYNRLPPTTGAYPGGSTPDFLPHQPPTTTTPLLLQSHPSSPLAAQPTFNPSGFLTPPSVSYEVFTPLFHPSPPKQSHYAHRQMLGQSGPKTPPPEPEATIRDYPGASSFFESQGSSGLAWSQNNQLPSPFGILPHESVTSSPGPGVVKSTYENNFNSPFNAGSPLNTLSAIPQDGFKTANFSDPKKVRAPSPSAKSVVNVSPGSSVPGAPFFQQLPTTYNDDSALGNAGALGNPGSYPVATTKVQSPLHQSCIVSAQSTPSGKDYRLQGAPRTPTTIFQGATAQDKPRIFGSSPGKTSTGSVPTKAQSKVYPDMVTPELRRDPTMESSQSSPISFSMMDRSMNYATTTTTTTTTNTPKLQSQRTPPNPGIQSQQYHVLNQQTPGQTSYRHYTGPQGDPEYHHPRSKSAASTDSAYSSNTSQNGPDCGVVVPRRPSPLQAHSQASPLGHVPSPAYPMYNSPMASMSSPSPLQHETVNQCSSASYKGAQQVTPPAPLDVTVPRPASQGQVGYPSVITRALGAGENRYERQEFGQKQICWENERQRKFPGYSGEMALGQGQRQGSTYFEGNQVPLQDLSSCRDPMSVKPLPQACQVQQQAPEVPPDVQKDVEERQRKIDPSKKRRSFDKSQPALNDIPPAPMTDYLNRVPPPAHHNSNQQSQNGYYDFERWNLPPAAPKVFPGSSGSFGAQGALHSGNFGGNQPQGLMGHTPAPIPYFPTFHLPSGAQPNPEFQPGVDIPSIPFENSNSSQPDYQDYREDQPKVIVPNIEEELGFLQQSEIAQQQANQLTRELKASSKDPNSGFMTSYLKFLQGERDPSPPAMRGGRKATWSRSRPYVPPELNRSCEANGQVDPKMQNSSKETPTIDYANDPRYFPLPKERKKPYIDSSDDGIESEDDFPFKLKSEKKKANGPVENALVKTEVPRPKKGRPIKPGGPTDRKRKAAALAAAQAAADAAAGKPPRVTKETKKETKKEPKKPKKEPLPPRRETSKRKAKEQISSKQLQEHSDGDEQGDSDSDPAWTPADKLGPGDLDKKKKRGRPVISKRAKNLLDNEDYSSVEAVGGKRGRRKSDVKNSMAKVTCKIDEKLLASVTDEDIDISPFKSGEFVVMKAELDEEYPALWRIDGKTLLQKYEPFVSNGRTLYRNISTYSGWAPQNRHIYQQVPVKFWQHSKMETIVEFLRDEMLLDDSEYVDRRIKEYEMYQDHFEVYIQTLISQALDSNFLTEIFQEQDDYFLSNVKTVDDMTEERKRLLLSTTKWGETVISAISTWPCLNILKDLPSTEYRGKQCNGCQLSKVFARVLLYGQPYNATTLEGSPPDLKVPQEKDFLLCRVCQTKVGLFNKVAHQKYLMFLECARRVADKRLADQNKDTTIILNELLADEVWLNQLFKEVRTIWAEIDNIEHQVRIKESAKTNREREIDCETNCNDVPSGTGAKTLIEGLTKASLMTDSGVSVS
ncbi:uncharacterized protein LOC107045755 isoform X2 [Diachasma alloeum]|uniref:uncharacterized protein LOC107045755 isoform X2 n=1 Tax=Diachasma alloeum TaxID=454923 RepID=UPI0007382DDA|nr:uncharacterized protein LOC107045755 isoform X2 [Diachasma alloeum]